MQGNHTVSQVNGLAYTRDLARSLTRKVVRQFRFPQLLRGAVEVLTLSSVFLVAGIVSLGTPLVQMLGPMVPVVCMMMFCMVASGVYRSEINNSIASLYVHSLYGFALATAGFLMITNWLPLEYSSGKFIFFFLFFAFFATNTIRPLISGTDFRDGGGRRKN